MDEFDRIKTYFAPLASGDGFAEPFGLSDDAFRLTPPAGMELVVTKDVIVENVHFLDSDPPDLIARKALRVNLSDIAAKGAKPRGYFLGCAWPKPWSDTKIKKFAEGLRQDQEAFDIKLWGGDTVSIKGPMVCSLTMIGFVQAALMVERSTARPGDLVYVSGSIGDAVAGLKCLEENLDKQKFASLVDRYHLPQPRTELGPLLIELASSALDVSDGLVADAGHIAACSRIKIVLELEKVPVSQSALEVIPDKIALITGGDDYEILFTAAPAHKDDLSELSQKLNLQITEIGRVEAGSGVSVIDRKGDEISIDRPGYVHSGDE